jgi:short-subunit dehydrogenase
MSRIEGKIALITGASSGIGEHVSYAMAKEGAKLVLIDRDQENLDRVATQCREMQAECFTYVRDLMKTDDLAQFIQEITNTTGSIDILINNAGMSQRSYAEETPVDNDRKIMELNFFSFVLLAKAVLPDMIKNKAGHIVVMSSIAGKFGFPMRTAYSASKHAVQGYFESLRPEVKKHNVKVSIISPGRVKTNISKNAMVKDGGKYGKMDAGQENGISAPACAAGIVKAIKKDKKDVLLGKKELIMVYIYRFIPALYHGIVDKIKN